MTRYRRKPVVEEIDAMQWTGDNISELWKWGGVDGIHAPELNPRRLGLITISGVETGCLLGEWVIRESGNPNRFYPCDPDVFEDRYEVAQ